MELPFDVKDQVGPCGITCGTCFLGDGSVANTAKKTLEYISMSGIKEWAPLVPEGEGLDWVGTEKVLSWMTKYAFCSGCENGGGPPDCAIRNCANQKGYQLCNECSELTSCTKFSWLGESSDKIKQVLLDNPDKNKSDFVNMARG
jgi:hypothetical protein